jgi:hypothetical protein
MRFLFSLFKRIKAMSDENTPVTYVNGVPVEADAQTPAAAPRTLAAVESDLLNAYTDLSGCVVDEKTLFESWVKSNEDRLMAEALAEFNVLKAKKTALVQELATELHSAHEWLSAKISAIL